MANETVRVRLKDAEGNTLSTWVSPASFVFNQDGNLVSTTTGDNLHTRKWLINNIASQGQQVMRYEATDQYLKGYGASITESLASLVQISFNLSVSPYTNEQPEGTSGFRIDWFHTFSFPATRQIGDTYTIAELAGTWRLNSAYRTTTEGPDVLIEGAYLEYGPSDDVRVGLPSGHVSFIA